MKLSASISIFPFLLIFVLFFTSCTKEERLTEKEALIYQITDDIKADSIESYVIWMQEMGTRFALANNRRNVAVSIKNRFIRMGYTDTKLDSFPITKTYRGVTYNQTQYNVIATLEGSTPNDSICIIGGHYDNITGTGDPFTVAPGANDNASGVAAAIEVARVFKENSFIPATTIKFIAFGSEEQGLYGSKAYALNASQTSVKIRFMLNNDMIAYQPGNDKSNWQINIIDYSNSRSFRYQAEGLCRKYTVLKPYNDNTYSNASDSYPFYNYGYKALFFFSRVMDPNYHTINDIAANCNFEYCSEIVKLNCAILVDRNIPE